MQNRGAEYFEEWEKEGNEYKKTKIQELSEQRRDESAANYNEITESSIGVKEAYKIYISDVREIQISLSKDQTSKGIETIMAVSTKIVGDGDNLKYSLSKNFRELLKGQGKK